MLEDWLWAWVLPATKLFVLMFKNPAVLEEIPTKLTLAYTSQMAIALMMSGELDHSLKKIF